MEWPTVVSLLATVLVVALVGLGAVELVRTTLGSGDNVLASAVVLALVAVAVVGTVAVGAKNGRWVDNPDAYW